MAAYGLKSHVGAAWENTVLICAKCSRRMDGGRLIAFLSQEGLAHYSPFYELFS
jgi:hypothetical protein